LIVPTESLQRWRSAILNLDAKMQKRDFLKN